MRFLACRAGPSKLLMLKPQASLIPPGRPERKQESEQGLVRAACCDFSMVSFLGGLWGGLLIRDAQ